MKPFAEVIGSMNGNNYYKINNSGNDFVEKIIIAESIG